MAIQGVEEPSWLRKDEQDSNPVVNILFFILAFVKSFGTALLTTVWIVFGLLLLNTNFPAFNLFTSFFENFWWLFMIIIFIFSLIVNFKQIRR